MFFKTITSKPISLAGREQSRRDGTLLTVDFNLRTLDAIYSRQVPQGRYFGGVVSSLRDFGGISFCLLRRLKPTVNQVLSLRDYLPLMYYGNN